MVKRGRPEGTGTTDGYTDRQILEALERHHSFSATARHLAVSRMALKRRLVRLAKREAPELVLKGTSILSKDGIVVGQWDKTRMRGRLEEETVQLPDPKFITKRSTLFDQEGRVTQQWIAEKPDERKREQLWREFAAALAEPLPRAEPVPLTPAAYLDHLVTGYPVGDHHMGLLAWKHEAGGSYDLEIGEKLLVDAFNFLTQAAPPTDQAVIAFLGDLMHYDSFEAVTPEHKNLLDADGRFPKMVRATVRAVRYAIVAALRRHAHVHVIVELGNHDPAGSIWLMEALANIFENEPRVTVDTSPRHFHYYSFGKTLLGVHHGHGTKLDNLPLIMAHDRAELWGQTTHRYWWTGHRHREELKSYPGCTVEIFPILPPTDAYAENAGYRGARMMKAVVFHREHGEVARYSVNPAMLEKP